jgi:hypothetical protein
MTGLPWGVMSADNHDLDRARKILDEDHYDLEKIKERILEFLAVRKLKPTGETYLVWDTLQRGLAIRVQPTGAASWKCIYSYHGRPRWLHLGDATAIGLADAREVDPTTVDWKALGEDHFPYRIRQDPGPANALGRVKFQLTNAFNVYLHDTPTRSLFGKSDRDLSHGCMRVEKPLELATQILGEAAQAPLREALDQTEERHLSVKPPVPIHIVYLTAWVDDDDALRFSPDIYEFDGPQRKALDHVSARLIGGPASGAKESAQPEAR